MSMSSFITYIQELDRRELYRNLSIFLAGIVLIFGLIFFLQRRQVQGFERKLSAINKQRDAVKRILQDHALVEEQRQLVDTILERDRNFRINQFLEELARDLRLSQNMSKNIEMENNLGNGYTEIQVETTFKDLDTRQLTDLLYRIEQSSRVFTKNSPSCGQIMPKRSK